MKPFLDENFLLQTSAAERLYHEYAKDMPIIDYHCHLPPKEIAEDHQFENLTKIWLDGDHYKWRAMRAFGVDEKYITGNAPDAEKFEKWAMTVPHTLRNPLYHWTHMELQKPFGIEKLLNSKTAQEVYEACTAMLQEKEFSVRSLIQSANVKVVCTTDDPVDSLEYHQKIKDDGYGVLVLPTWRPDKAITIENPVTYNAYLDELGEVAGVEIKTYDDLWVALRKRHDFFASMGGQLSDHGLETLYAEDYTESEIKAIFSKARDGKSLNEEEVLKFRSAMLYELAILDHEKGWTQQFHVGALRNNNSRLLGSLGPDTGFDSMGDFEVGRPLSKFLDRLDSQNQLCKTILYNLNPRDNELMATMIGNFQDGSVAGKMQFGSGWWFLDQKDGMEKQMDALSNMGLLSQFVGMLTDSRSFLSYSRHEYFRRTLCNLLGNDMDGGLIPADFDLVGQMVQDISYNNAKKYFNFF